MIRYCAPRCLLALLALAVCGWAAAAPVRAQRTVDYILVFPPVPEDRAADSAYAVELAAEIRDGLMRWRRSSVRMVEFCLEIETCEELFSNQRAFHTARMLRADVYVTGEFRRASPSPEVTLHIRETARRGGVPHFTTSLTVQADTALDAGEFADRVGDALKDTLGAVLRASHSASECWERVRDRRYDDAVEEAERAFRDFPNHPSAARCLSYVYLAKQDSDSLLWSLQRAVAGDPGMADAWEELGLEYARRGDPVRAVQARIREVHADPDNAPRRMEVARLLDRMGEEAAAVALVRDGAERAGGDLEFRHLLARMCYEYQMWRCALEAFAALYPLDSTLVGDTTFYVRIIAVAQTLADTSAVDQWTQEAVRHVQLVADDAWERAEQARRDAERTEELLQSMRMARAALLADIGERDSALAIYRGIASADPLDARAPFAAAQLLTRERFLALDSAVPLDSAALNAADSLLASAVQRSDDEQVHRSVALLYFEVGARLVQNRVAPDIALGWLAKALEHEPDSTLRRRATAMAGVAYFYLVEDVDAQVRREQTCELVASEAELVAAGLLRMPEVAREFPTIGRNVASALAAYDALLPAYRRALQCEAGTPALP